MTDRELLAKLEGYLAANLDRGLTPEQVQEALKMLREPTETPWTIPYNPRPPQEIPCWDERPWWQSPITCGGLKVT